MPLLPAPTFVHLTSGCKVNLFLRVGERLPSGYHNLETLFIPLPRPCDTLDVIPAPKGLRVVCDNPAVDPLKNTLTKAYETYTAARPLLTGFQVTLHKNVPIGGGLGGGSANAAALLSYMQTQPARDNRPPLTQEELMALGKNIGADVPFFLTTGCQQATGIGEKLTPCPNPFADHFLLLVCPAVPISTAWAFTELSLLRKKNEQNPQNDLTCSGHQDSNTSSQAGSFQNDFEEVVFKAHPELKRIKESLFKGGAEIALLSGTGACLFGIFKKEDFAQKVMDKTSHTVYLVKL